MSRPLAHTNACEELRLPAALHTDSTCVQPRPRRPILETIAVAGLWLLQYLTVQG
jgi:hypothetical protein